ncbi:hypothetical protein [Pseudomonas sp. BC42]|uniref:hypothetical protein n=1 Tax=Pseudomonas sp. BC42 TaxID=2933816 RepID=UPI001F2418A4|nr:hypothetical protein [Pseudomonas sp. BC42]ULT73041.1 hypothetical protein L1O02_11945 [Pseudomonas sp. BC42]
MLYHSNEYSERYNEFCRVFWFAHRRSKHLQVWSFDSIDDLKPYLEKIVDLDVKTLLEKRTTMFDGVQLYVDSGAAKIKSGFKEGNIFLPLTSTHEAFPKIVKNPGSDTFYIPHSKEELALYLERFPDSVPL